MGHASCRKQPTATKAASVVTQQQKTAFRRALRRAREAAGESQSGLSQKLGLSRSAVWQWENGETVPTPDNVATVEQALRLQPGSLSRLLGYLPAGAVDRETISVIEALETDPRLGERERELLAAMYRQLVKQREGDT
jgi:transcriptional regulator with XRE-family HTH domain